MQLAYAGGFERPAGAGTGVGQGSPKVHHTRATMVGHLKLMWVWIRVLGHVTVEPLEWNIWKQNKGGSGDSWDPPHQCHLGGIVRAEVSWGLGALWVALESWRGCQTLAIKAGGNVGNYQCLLLLRELQYFPPFSNLSLVNGFPSLIVYFAFKLLFLFLFIFPCFFSTVFQDRQVGALASR